jgi:hypothetical protein
MATVVKDFKVKAGLVVEGANATVGGSDIITEDAITGGTQTNISVTYNPTTKSVDFVAESGLGDGDTDDLVEGSTNLYFTDARAKTSAADLLTSATLTNITITGTGAGLTITAENGVDDSTTDDLDEGITNKYFSDTLARGAVDAGDGLDYNPTSGVFSADLGNGLQFDVSGQIEIDTNVVATQTDLSTDIGAHSDATSGVHGVTGDVVGTVDAQTLTNKDLGSGTTLSANLDANGFTVTGLATPTNGTDAVTKQYVDGLSAGLTWKAAVNLLSSTNVSLTGTDGTLVIDGHSALDSNDVGYRLLLTGQTTATENGIYDYTVSGGNYTLTRSADSDSDAELHGAAVFVMEGAAYGSTSWIQVNHYVASFANQEWDQFSGAGTYIAGNGLSLDGNEFSIDTDVTATKSYVDEEIDAHTELTTAHGVAGDIVGTSDTQTLTNKTLGSGTVLGSDLDGINTYKVVNLIDPTSNQDAATKKYVDDEIVDVSSTIDNLNTDDIAELSGATNLYFTDARAVSALEAVVPNFTEVDINDVATQVAASGTLSTTSAEPVYAFAHAEYRSAKFLVKTASGNHTQVSEILLTLDSSNNIAVTEYAIVGTNGNIADISADISGGSVRVLVDAVNAGTVVTISGTLLK